MQIICLHLGSAFHLLNDQNLVVSRHSHRRRPVLDTGPRFFRLSLRYIAGPRIKCGATRGFGEGR
jgi:hypothetical protein